MSDTAGTGSRSIRALEVLEIMADMDRPASATDIEAVSGLPKATVHRLCNLLLDEGFLHRDVSGRGYELGDRGVRLAMKMVAGQGGRGERRAILESVARDIGETCNITIPSTTEMLYLDRVESAWPLRIQLPPGSHVPMYCTASGKLYLSTLSHAARRRLLSKLDLVSRAPNTMTDVDSLMTATDLIAGTEVGTDNEEFIPGMVAVAVPIKGHDGRLMATLATHGPLVRMSHEQAAVHVDRLRRAAAEIAETLGS